MSGGDLRSNMRRGRETRAQPGGARRCRETRAERGMRELRPAGPPLWPAAAGANDIFEGADSDGLGEMFVETGGEGFLPVRILTIAGDRDEIRAVRQTEVADLAGQIVARHAGHGDVGDDDVGNDP